MNTFRSLGITLLAALVLAGCGSSGDQVSLSHRNFSDEVSQQQNLVFTFSDFLVPSEKMGQWMEEDYITFSPAVKGKFRWTQRDQLTFSPDQGFNPSTAYSAKLNSSIAKGADKKVAIQAETFKFHTPYLEMNGREIFWAMGAGNVPEVHVSMTFNYPVDPKSVASLLQVNVGDAEAAYQMATQAVSQIIEMVVPQKSESFDNKNLAIALRKGLKTEGSSYLAEGVTFESNIPEKDRFKINQAIGELYDDDYVIHVYTNQAIGSSSLRDFVQITPSVDFNIEKLEHGFLVKGDFASGTSYNIKVGSELKGIFGGKLPSGFEQSVLFGEVSPSIAFSENNSLYLTAKGNREVGMKIMAVAEVDVKVYKVYRNNIMHYLREDRWLRATGKSDGYDDDYYYDDYYYNSVDINDFADLVLDKRISTKDLKAVSGLKMLPIGLKDNNADMKGIYIVKVSSTEERYVNDETIVSISDIGLIAKSSSNQVMVVANSIKTTEPLSGVEIKLVSSNNQEVLIATTDAEGIATFEDLKKTAPGFAVNMVTAEQGDDFNYLHFRQTPVNTAEFEIGGLMDNASGVMAYIYGDRNLYRPGETVHLKTIVRDRKWQPLPNVPFKLKVLLPSGKPFATRKGELNEEGTFDMDINLPGSAVTGSYGVEVYSGNNVLIGSNSISVEEFMPDRIKVIPELSKDEFKPGETVTVSGQVLNMFGPPAVDRNMELEMMVSRKYFYSKKYKDYNFHIREKNQTHFKDQRVNTKTDTEGKFSRKFDVPSIWKNHGLLEGKFYVTAFDETGRPVSRLLKADIVTQPAMLGMGRIDYYVKTGAPLRIPMIALSHKGELANNVKAKIQVIYHKWQSYYERDGRGRYRYVSRRKETVEREKTVTINGTSQSFNFVPNESGSYEVRLMFPGSDAYVTRWFYSYRWGSTSISTYQVDKDGKISISLDKESYQTGETAKMMFKVPFHGKMLVTLERDRVIKHFTIDTKETSVVQELKVDSDLLPNAFISATIIKPIEDSSLPITVAHGYEPIMVEDPKRKINLTIDAPEKSRSKVKQKVTVTSDLKQSNIEMTIAVVDEGILQIKNYKTPDPYSFFYQKRGLMVNSYDLYARLFPEYKSTASSFGSDGYDLAKRVNPLANKRVKLLSLWSGTVKTNSSGKATYEFELPEFSGEVRIMAVANKGNAFGSADKPMKVADPLVVSAGLPRFMSPGDEVVMPVTVSNTTDKSTTAKAVIKTSGTVTVLGSSTQSVTIPANSEKRVIFKVQAKKEIGQGQVIAQVDAMGESFAQTTDMTVRPATSLLKASGSGVIENGKTELVDLQRDYLVSSVKGKLLLSRSPLVGMGKSMKYLVGYPHGCLEQTVSKAMPQIYFADMMKSMDDPSFGNPEYNVNAAIGKIMTMQMYNGGLSYWQGSTNINWWATAYAAHFLIEAKKAGYEVEDTFLDKVLGYLRQKVRNNKVEDYEYYDGAGILQMKKIAPRETYYTLYVLALAGKPERSTMNYYKNRPELASLDAKYLLASAYLMSGDNANYRKLLPSEFSGEKSKPVFAGGFYSYVRDQGIVLSALVENDPNNPQVPRLARNLSKEIRTRRYLSTQEHTFSLLALGKLARQANASKATATVKVDGKTVGQFSGKDLVLSEEAVGKKASISVTGGDLYYFWDIEGLSQTGEYLEEDNFLKVRRDFFTRDGQKLTASPTVDQNDLIVVRISLISSSGHVQNVVMTDMLPGGFEVENPRISKVAGTNWVTNKSNPEHIDFRDDRVNMYATAYNRTKYYYYVVRAVTKGTYQLGPVGADAMYNGEYHSYHGAGTVTVR